MVRKHQTAGAHMEAHGRIKCIFQICIPQERENCQEKEGTEVDIQQCILMEELDRLAIDVLEVQ